MIKILFSSLSGIPRGFTGGPNKVIYLLMQNLPPHQFETAFVSKHGKFKLNSIKSSNLYLKKDLIREYLFKMNKLYRKFFLSSFYLKRFFPDAIKKVQSFITISDFDILNAHDIRSIFNLDTNKRIILSLHSNGSIVNDMLAFYGNRLSLSKIFDSFKQIEKDSLGKVDQIIFPSQAAMHLYFNDLNLDARNYKTSVIYTGIDLDKINSINVDLNFKKRFPFLNEDTLKILNVGNHIKVKNIDKILITLSLLKRKTQKFKFINVGSGPLTKKLNRMVRELNLNDNVIFLPILKNDDIIRLMKSCDIYISLSDRVIFDFVILEALACGMKVIASNDGGNREIIVDNYNGYLVNIGDYEKIISLITSEKSDLRENINSSIQNFSIKKMIADYIKVYEE